MTFATFPWLGSPGYTDGGVRQELVEIFPEVRVLDAVELEARGGVGRLID